jgi:RNA 2',3'-cyclic 3'-phosphodiesterase
MKKTIRTFIAMPLSEEIRHGAIQLIRKLREPDDGIKWVPTDNLHLTFKFLGDVENTEVMDICNSLHELCSEYEPFELIFKGADGLPDIERTRVVCASIEDPTLSLTELATRIDKEMAGLGFKPEPRDYKPHLTLGRAKSRKANEDVIERLKLMRDHYLGTMLADTVCLVASFMDKTGPTYQIMDTIELG